MPAADNNQATVDLRQIREDFTLLDGWEARYRYIIELGDGLPHLPQEFRTARNLVQGCMSNAWIHAEAKDGRLDLRLDSEARIVRGLIAIVRSASQMSPLESVAARDFEALFAELDLLPHLSPSRGNGLRSLVERVKFEASRLMVNRGA